MASNVAEGLFQVGIGSHITDRAEKAKDNIKSFSQIEIHHVSLPENNTLDPFARHSKHAHIYIGRKNRKITLQKLCVPACSASQFK